ncbi:MAG: glycosyltransferase family 2 protein [Arenicella sp.]
MNNDSKNQLTVSVLISAYNVEKYIHKSIESVLRQTYQNLEILIVDDGSSDSTFDIIQSFKDSRIHCYSQANKGKSSTLNDLCKLAAGEYILIHDADDISMPRRVETLLNAFKQDSSLGLVMSSYCLILDDQFTAPKPRMLSKKQCKSFIDRFEMPAHDPTLMIKTELAQALQYDPSLILAEGYDFILRAAEQASMIVLKDVLYAYRLQPSSITHAKQTEKPTYVLKALNKARKRRDMPLIDYNDFIEQYEKDFHSSEISLAMHFNQSVFLLIQDNRRKEAIQVALASASRCFRHILYLKPLIVLLLPKSLAVQVRQFLRDRH